MTSLSGPLQKTAMTRQRFFRQPVTRIVALGLVWTVALALLGPQIERDTASYIADSPFRPPLLPLYLDVLHLLFGRGFLYAAVAGQAALGFASSLLLANRISTLAGSTAPGRWLVSTILLWPQLEHARWILSESLAYSFLCLTVWFSLEPFVRGMRWRAAAGTCVALALLLMTRVQFAPMVLVGALVVVVGLVRLRSGRDRLLVLGAAVGAALLVVGTQAAYTKATLGYPSRVAATGVQLLTVLAYVSVPADAQHITDPSARMFTDSLMAELKKKRLLSAQRREMSVARHFSYAVICNRTLIPLYRRLFSGTDENALWVSMDKLTTRAAVALLRTGWRRYLHHMAILILQTQRYFGVLAALLVGCGVELARRSSTRGLGVLLAGSAVFWWFNVISVTAVQYPQLRYTFYFDTLVIAGILAGLSRSDRPPGAADPGSTRPG